MSEEHVEQQNIDDSPHIPVVRQLSILAGILLLIFGSGYVPKLLRSLDANDTSSTAAVQSQTESNVFEKATENTDYFEDIAIRAEAAYVWDVAKQRSLYQKSPDKQLPLASITKLMTALVAHELLERDAEVAVTDNAIKQDGNSGLLGGESFSVQDLLNLTLLSSSNDGAYAIAAAAGTLLLVEINETEQKDPASTFVEAMNIRASELGLTQTFFKNPTGLDITETESGAYGSARDITFLMEYILTNFPEILEATTKDEAAVLNSDGIVHVTENTNPTVARIEGLIGSKTGYTDLAGGNLAIAFDGAFNRPIIIVVLGSSRTGRFEDVLSLVDSARKSIAQ